MVGNEMIVHDKVLRKQQQQEKSSIYQPQSSSYTNELEIRHRTDHSERASNNRSRKLVVGKEDERVINGKFDFGDRDEKPSFNITLPLLKEVEGKEWTIDELRILHNCINSYGMNDNCVFNATKNIPNRSTLDIQEKISGIRELTRLRHEMRVEARKTEWLKKVILPSKTSEIQDWSNAVHVIQNRKRRINDYTDSAVLDYLAHEVKCRPASVDTKKYFRITDSSYPPCANRRQIVDCADYYRFLQACLSGTATVSCKPFDSAIILNILEEIQKEVDDPKHEKRRRILAGMFRNIQTGDLSDYDFPDTTGSDDMLCVQLNPLNLMREMLETGNEQS
ncbi:hypothetical protein QQG55_45285 [Brugia pahangi]